MKKIFMILILSLFVMTPAAFAWNTQVADGEYNGNSFSDKYTSDSSSWYGNDEAGSASYGNAGGLVTTHASGIGYATESGSVDASSRAGGNSFAYDLGRKSVAGASADFYGEAKTKGSAWGVFGDRETVNSNVYVDGHVYQTNSVGETGYSSGSGITAGNYSVADFSASDSDYESGGRIGLFGVRDTNAINGAANVNGFSAVKGDFYGNQRSIAGYSRSSANVDVARHLISSDVQGAGGVSGVIANRNNYAGGNVGYEFTGRTAGSGSSTLNANINVNGNSSNVSVSGSSSAYGN